MKSVCAWCGSEMKDAGPASHPDELVSHGICESCSEKLWREAGTPIVEFLASLEIPTYLVDEAGRIKAASKTAVEWLDQGLEEVEGQLQGDVFQCVNAGLPGGCGQTVKCSACTVRNTILETFSTGTAHDRVPATLEVMDSDKPREVLFYLTTRRVGERVMVRIDPPS